MKARAVKGTHDVLPDQQPAWRALRSTAERVLERAGVRELTTPAFEFAETFETSVGESADLVVQKEMYTFADRGGRRLALRPEFTASVLRSFISHGMHTWPSPVKLWSLGPLFRAENVQRGRYRQFHQLNCEVLGLEAPLADAETIALLHDVLRALGVRDTVVKLGSVGDPEDRSTYNAYLREALRGREAELSPTSQERLRLNPMRVLDSKDADDQSLVRGLDRPLDRIGAPARAHLEAVAGYLREWDVPFEYEPALVRGLDYYVRTAFEVHAGGIGAQSALAGGGRYDGLVQRLGGPATPGIGWGLGVERVLDALEVQDRRPALLGGPKAYLVPMDEPAVGEAARMARRLREWHHVQHGYVPRGAGKGLRDADRAGATFAALRGGRERAHAQWTLKRLDDGTQRDVSDAGLADALREE